MDAVSSPAFNTTFVGKLNALKIGAMLPYYPLDNAYWFLKIGVLTGLDPLRVGRLSCFFWAISLFAALTVNIIKLRALYHTIQTLARKRRAAIAQTDNTTVASATSSAVAVSGGDVKSSGGAA